MQRAQEINPHDGSILVSQLIDAPLDGNDFVDVFLNTLYTAFGVNPFDDESELHKRAKLVFTALQQQQVTKYEFSVLLMDFLTRCRFPNWTVADFFPKKWEREKLHPHSWYVEQVRLDRTATQRIEAFKIDDVVWYRYKGGRELTFERVDLHAKFNEVYTIPMRTGTAQTAQTGASRDDALRELNRKLVAAYTDIEALQKTVKLLREENEQLLQENSALRQNGEFWDLLEEQGENEGNLI